MNTYVRVGGSWKKITRQFVRVSGVWKELRKNYVRVGGSWKITFDLVVPGSVNFTGTGYHNFTIPAYNNLTAQVWGAGGGSSPIVSGTFQIWNITNFSQTSSGGVSYFIGNSSHPWANGGTSPISSHPLVFEATPGSGGTAQGGTTNTTGSSGGPGSTAWNSSQNCSSPPVLPVGNYGFGGNSPNGGGYSYSPQYNGGGTTGIWPGGGAAAPSGTAYYNTNPPYGGWACNTFRAFGGGGGGYSYRAYVYGQLVYNSIVTILVGGGGPPCPSSGNIWYNGAYGAGGRVLVSWS